jgi:hypothetical protein
MSYDEVMFKRSYLTLILLNRAIPSVKPFDADDEQQEQQETTVQRNTINQSQRTRYKNMDELFMSMM